MSEHVKEVPTRTAQWEGETLYAVALSDCTSRNLSCHFFEPSYGCTKLRGQNLECLKDKSIIWLTEVDYVAATLSGLLNEDS